MAQGANPGSTAAPQGGRNMTTGYQPIAPFGPPPSGSNVAMMAAPTAAPKAAPTASPAPAPASAAGSAPAPAPAPAAGSAPPSNTFYSGQNVYDSSANALTLALQGTQGLMTGMPDTKSFMNPYTQQVIDTSTAELERQRQIAQQDVAANAVESNAYGGSRQGVAEAETNRAYADMQAQMLADLYSQGYDKSLAAAQAQQNLQLQAAGQMGNLSQTGFGFGQDLTNTQWQQGALQQALNQALIDASKAQYSGFSGAPALSSSILNAATGAASQGQGTVTQTQQPGLMDILAAAAGVVI